MEDIAKIKERIAKLLAMANDSSSPNEAAIAMGRARKMMDAYQLSEFDISKKMVDEFAKGAATKFSKAIAAQMSTLAVAVAKYNDCAARYENGWVERERAGDFVAGKRIQFLGYKTDVDLAIQMFERLEATIRRLSKEYILDNFPRTIPRIRNNFELGASSIIVQRLKEMTTERQMITQNGSGTSLVIIKKDAVDKYFGETKYRSGGGRASAKDWADLEAHQAGRIKGATVEITPQVKD